MATDLTVTAYFVLELCETRWIQVFTIWPRKLTMPYEKCKHNVYSFYPYGRVLSLLSISFFDHRYLGEGGTNRCEILHDGTYVSQMCLLPFWGRCPQGIPKSKICQPPYGGYCVLLMHLLQHFVLEYELRPICMLCWACMYASWPWPLISWHQVAQPITLLMGTCVAILKFLQLRAGTGQTEINA